MFLRPSRINIFAHIPDIAFQNPKIVEAIERGKKAAERIVDDAETIDMDEAERILAETSRVQRQRGARPVRAMMSDDANLEWQLERIAAVQTPEYDAERTRARATLALIPASNRTPMDQLDAEILQLVIDGKADMQDRGVAVIIARQRGAY